jgi:hypothetical protein
VDLLGGEAVTIQDVAALPETDLSALLDPLHPAAETEFRPTLVDKARAIRLHRACREKVERRHSGAPPTHTAPSADRKIKLSALVDTTIEAELQPLDPPTVAAMFERYKTTRGDYPLDEHKPTPDQLAAVQQLIRADVPPYVDFSIFGPHGKRMTKKIHLVAHVYDPSSGAYQRHCASVKRYGAGTANSRSSRRGSDHWSVSEEEQNRGRAGGCGNEANGCHEETERRGSSKCLGYVR